MTTDERNARIRQLQSEQAAIFDGAITHRQIASLENIKLEFDLIGADYHANSLGKRIAHYSEALL